MAKLDKKTGKPRTGTESGFNREKRQIIFHSQSDQKDVKLHFNTSSSGMLSKTAYQCADALCIDLMIENQPFLINPGIESYNKANTWKTYFKGTIAHNTIRVNLKDQAPMQKPFNWTNQYKTTILETNATGKTISAKARHDGYRKFGVTHSREIIFDKSKNLIWIYDTVECEKSGFHFIELPFHFHPQISVKQNNAINFQANGENEHLIYIVLDKKLKTKLVKGQVIPQILGWYSESKDKKEPCNTIYCTAFIEQTITFQSIILIK